MYIDILFHSDIIIIKLRVTRWCIKILNYLKKTILTITRWCYTRSWHIIMLAFFIEGGFF